MKKIYLAGGCFWGVEAFFKKLPGVVKTTVGYANGISTEATYKNLKNTDHAETVEIEYDENRINLAELLERFLYLIDPYSINKQGEDEGRQYRTGIYYLDDYSKNCANLTIKYFEKAHNNKKVSVEVLPLKHFIDAEDYHQDYLDKNPNGYCHINLQTAYDPIWKFDKLSKEEIEKLNLSKADYDILINKDTEMPFTSELLNQNEDGLYVDKISKQPLFISDDKFDAGCGWPSFSKPIISSTLMYQDDYSIKNRKRVEVLSNGQESHLGHVFNDGPQNMGGLRYCINGASLTFIPLKQLNNTIYERFIPYFKASCKDAK